MRSRTATYIVASGQHLFIHQPVIQFKLKPHRARARAGRIALPRFVIGASDAADIRLADPTVSALHCEILCDAQGLRVRDLDSKNGTWLARH